MNNIPVIAIDGPGGVGKGALSLKLAKALNWHILDSGAIYRAFAVYAMDKKLDLYNEDNLLMHMPSFILTYQTVDDGVQIIVCNTNITARLRNDEVSANASIIAKYPKVRETLLYLQKSMRKSPGLIADGRDMGTVVFDDAILKIFLIASAEIRAQRRYNQLIVSDKSVNISAILSEINERDRRDSTRTVSPLVPAKDAVIIDTSDLTLDEVYKRVWLLVKDRKIA